MTPAIELQAVTKDFAIDWRGTTRRALHEVSFKLQPGRVGALVGPNGSGKTTVLKLCAGLTTPSAGAVRVAAGGRIGYVADDTTLPGYLTVEGALARLAALYGVELSAVAGEVAAALAAVALTAERSRRVGELSKGQRQRAALAQALLGSPSVLLFDEPAAALDPRAMERFAELIATQRAAGRTVLFSSHFLPQVEQLADDFLLLEQGRVLFAGDRAALAARGGLESVYLEAVRA